jgi:hypothetical protein
MAIEPPNACKPDLSVTRRSTLIPAADLSVSSINVSSMICNAQLVGPSQLIRAGTSWLHKSGPQSVPPAALHLIRLDASSKLEPSSHDGQHHQLYSSW